MDLQSAIYRYCNYQERCQQEVRNKLHELKASPLETENLIAELIEADLLNEERFARSFARGKFRIKQWGRVKIIQQLKQQKISDYCIKKGISEIDEEEYHKVVVKSAERKWNELRGERNGMMKRSKLFRFLQQRGFETALITEVIAGIIER